MRLFTIPILSFVLLAQQTSAADAAPAVTEQRNAAVGFALTMDLFTNSLANTCAAFGGVLGEKARNARSEWKKRNSSLVDSAHQYLQFVRAEVSRRSGEEAAKKFFEAQRSEFVKSTQAALRQAFPNGSADEDGCEKQIAAITGAMDIGKNVEFNNVLEEIRTDMSAYKPK